MIYKPTSILALTLSLSLIFQSPFAKSAGGRATSGASGGVTATGETIISPNATQTKTQSGTVTTTTTKTEAATAGGPNSYSATTVNTSVQDSRIAAQQADKSKNIENQGKSAGGMQMIGALAGAAGAAYSAYRMIPPATTCVKTGQGCMQAALWAAGIVASLAIAAAMMKAKKESDKTVADATVKPGGSLSDPTSPEAIQEAKIADRTAQAERSLKAAESKVPGLKTNLKAGTIQFPNGKVLTADQLGNPKAMASAGLSKDDIKTFDANFKEAMKAGEKEALKGMDKHVDNSYGDEIGVAGSNKGGGSGGVTAAGETGVPGTAVNHDPSQVSGLTRNFNGDPIGVSSDNLFTLVNRRYELHGQRNNFLVPQKSAALPAQ